MTNEEPTQEYLKSILHYDKDTGNFMWRLPKGHMMAGSVAGTINDSGYIIIHIDTKRYRAHRLAWLYFYGKLPYQSIDHINQIKNDNRIDNLRVCTQSQNCANRRKQKNNKSGYKGVSWDKRNKKWLATITINYAQKYLGSYLCSSAAADAYNKAAFKYFGVFAYINKIKDTEPRHLDTAPRKRKDVGDWYDGNVAMIVTGTECDK